MKIAFICSILSFVALCHSIVPCVAKEATEVSPPNDGGVGSHFGDVPSTIVDANVIGGGTDDQVLDKYWYLRGIVGSDAAAGIGDVADPVLDIADDNTSIVSQLVRPLMADFLSESKLLVEKAWNSKAEEEALNRLHDDFREFLHFSELCSTKHSSLADVSACIQAKVEASRHQGQQEMKLLDQPLEELKSVLAAFPPQLESEIQKTLEKFETVLVNILDAYEKAQLQTGVAASRIMDFRKATKKEIQELYIETDMNAWVVTGEAFQRAKDAKLHDMDYATESPFWKLYYGETLRDLDSQRDEAMAHVAEKCKAAWVQILGDFEGGGVPNEMESTEPSEL